MVNLCSIHGTLSTRTKSLLLPGVSRYLGLLMRCWIYLTGIFGSCMGLYSVAVAETQIQEEAAELPTYIRHSIVKSAQDKRQYSYLVLPNQLNVLLISDPEAEKAAAALSVATGAYQNPPEREGLAHFLEHMLFLGTEKYPEAGAYQAFITQQGGTFNAYTALENTTYFFDIDPAQLEPALDRFAQFFIAPLFTREYVERERQAVHAEFMARIKDDGRREWEVLRELFNPAHPGAKFTVGNLTTLEDREGKSLRDELIEFYQRHYSADLMNLVVVGREGLPQLEAWVISLFNQVPLHEHALARDYPPLIEPERLPMSVDIKPERDQRRLSFNFPIGLSPEFATKKPYDYIAQQLAHEGKGSLLSFLKRLGWAEAVSAGLMLKSREDALFQIDIELTPQGVRARDQLVSLVFYAIEQLRSRGINSWRYQEMQEIAQAKFIYQEKLSPLETARRLSEAMFDYTPTQLLYNDLLYSAFDERLIKESLQPLNPANLMLVLVAPDIEAYRVSKRYSAPYTLRYTLPQILDLKIAVKQELSLPERNLFIPRSLAVKSNSMLEQTNAERDSIPQLIFRDRDARLWYAQDHQFEQPKAVIQLALKSPLVAGSIEGAVQAELYAALLRDQLNEYTYPAKLAGIDYRFEANPRGFELQISGFSSRQNLLLNKIIESCASASFKPERFENIKQKLLRDWRNRDKNLPYQVMMQEIPALQLEPYWTNRAMTAALETIDFPRFSRFAEHMLLDAKMDMLIFGNYFRQEALKLAVLVDHNLLNRQTGREMPPAKVFSLAAQNDKPWLYRYSIDHSDAVVQLLMTADSPDITTNAHMRLLQQIIKPAFYTRLRTEKQLGYVVAAISMPLRQLDTSLLIVQSPVASETQLVSEIEGFLQQQEASIADDLRVNQQSLATKLREPARSLTDQAQRYWQSIVVGDLDFSRTKRLADAVEAITPESLLEYYNTHFLDARQRLWLVAHPLADEAGYHLLEDIAAYKVRQDAHLLP
ncbi:insulinase family protein [Cellvibrio japonicus]|uniref:Protease 3 n=1 Tax=Cellvibrio japonicus (strain Ueda107) TaxID=498211 RepID=B3PCX1_CELJU|nr:insulinase family protein [Cellvibrio japonicus]ACE85039.1 putative peptidase, insulinase family [Cellvibrio japonicus Ueda107]QEI11916.1 peptidase M16 [Cellvibrio japonicus]QEI15490.1 peptidase M16 [Cellvibrio japonicus]QEI19069.1 peptidase M16 [Cellvibrio japonicus]